MKYKSSAVRRWGAGSTTTAAIIAVALVRCGGDQPLTSSNPAPSSDSGGDAAGGALTDRTLVGDGRSDADGNPGTGMDGASDGSGDGGASEGSDADGDVGRDGSLDAKGDSEAGPQNGDGATDAIGCALPVPDAASDLPAAYTNIVCSRTQFACGLSDPSFNGPLCHAAYNPAYGGFLRLMQPATYLDGGRIAYDPGAACRCLESAASLDQGVVGAGALGAFRSSCLQAFVGTSPIGDGGCRSSFECVAGGFCSVPTDGGLGTCMAIEEAGAPCASSEMCDYIENGTHVQRCLGTSKTCSAAAEAGVACSSDSDCISSYCLNTTNTCQNGFNFGAVAICNAFTIQDAGSGADAGGTDAGGGG